MKRLPAVLILLVLAGCKTTSNLEVVTAFDSSRYLGTWYEVVRYPHRFEDGLDSVSATYSRNDDDSIKVVNRGYNAKSQQWEEIEGVARLKGREDEGWLKVSFFRPFYASYKIIHLDCEYQTAIVTGPTYNYLWILVRDPALPQQQIDGLVRRAEAFGFDRSKMIQVAQTKNL
jgi:apolipoprotein D and lipocalin family protein